MSTIARRLAAVRGEMASAGYDALIVPMADEYLGEYVPVHNQRLRWLTGFTGSAGLALVLPQRAAIFVDGRYTVQVRAEVDAELFEYHSLVEDPHAQWLAAELAPGARIACDPRMHSLDWYRATSAVLVEAGMELIADSDNLVDRCWRGRPQPQVSTALLLGEEFSGESSLSKRRRLAGEIAAKGCDAALVFAPDSVSWLLNVRGTDIPQLPILQSFALLQADGDMVLFVDPRRLPRGFAEHVGDTVRVVPKGEAEKILAGYGDRKVLADAANANGWTQLILEENGARLIAGQDPVLLPKACKNAVEQAGTRRAHQRDAVAVIRFLAWLDSQIEARQPHDEASLSDKLLSLRQQGELFHENSFNTISAAGANAAMCHYNHLNGRPAALPMDSVYLCDSGGQYTDGTTDITRSVAIGDPPQDIRRMFTLVLKGHIALAGARFPHGTTGSQLDVLARQYLWSQGFDYAHGTGHGVGVFLNVHEGPQRISKQYNGTPLSPGMIVSNEPGYYRDGAYGIRCENLVLVRESEQTSGEIPMLEFETLTLVPFDTRLLDTSLMTAQELAWLDGYHRQVAERIGPLLSAADRQWLQRVTAPING